MIKRSFDLVLALPGLIAASPLLALLGILVRLRLGSPVLFIQVRPGLGGRPFRMYKFRTMTDERGRDGEFLPDASRLTRFGRLLRATSLDELPELFNVVKGDMSLVGPRPLLMRYLPRYTPRQFRRHEVRPGITGWAQVNGRNALTWEEKFELDVWYVENRSIGLDVKILWRTVRQVLMREGVSAEGHATMPEFLGSPPESGEAR
ncbi:MAG: sugar transferase [Deferrisomatales bacterium]|nr:sugar transferase [Deferrisomatales bacterium]